MRHINQQLKGANIMKYSIKAAFNEPKGVEHYSVCEPTNAPILSDHQLACTRLEITSNRIQSDNNNGNPLYILSSAIIKELNAIDAQARKLSLDDKFDSPPVAKREERTKSNLGDHYHHKLAMYDYIEDLQCFAPFYNQEQVLHIQLVKHQNAYRAAKINLLGLCSEVAVRDRPSEHATLIDFSIEVPASEHAAFLAQKELEVAQAEINRIERERAALMQDEAYNEALAIVKQSTAIIKASSSKAVPPPPSS